MRHGPRKILGQLFLYGNEQNSQTNLRDSKIRCIQETPFRDVSKFLKPGRHMVPIIFKDCIENSTDVFDHDGPRLAFLNDADGVREQISFVKLSKLFAGYREWRARQACGHQIHTAERHCVERFEVGLDDIPAGAVRFKSCAAIPVDLDQACMTETGLFQSERLSTGTSAQFQNRQFRSGV